MKPGRPLSEFSRDCLVNAGWYEGRKIPTESFEEANRNKGLYVSEKAILFLEEFGNLLVSYPDRGVPERRDSCHFDVVRATNQIIPLVQIRQYEFAIGKRLTIIGEASGESTLLCMGEDGSVYWGYERTLARIGESGEEAINCLCEGGNGIYIDVPRRVIPAAQEEPHLSDAARAALAAGGWKEPPSGPRDYRTKPTVFLAKYAGATFGYPKKNTDTGADVCRIGPYYPSQQFLRECARHLGVNNIEAVGEFEASGMLLLMDERGRVFGALKEITHFLWFFGSSGNDAINNLVSGREEIRVL